MPRSTMRSTTVATAPLPRPRWKNRPLPVAELLREERQPAGPGEPEHGETHRQHRDRKARAGVFGEPDVHAEAGRLLAHEDIGQAADDQPVPRKRRPPAD